MNPIATVFDESQLGDPQSFGRLSVFPLLAGASADPDYVTLDYALANRLASVREVSEGGSVPELRFENRSDKKILLVDGEELVGARQNRILNLTILVDAFQQVVIPVSCVERGRWAYVSREFHSAGRKLFARARAAKMGQVSRALREDGNRKSDQMRIWEEVALVNACHGVDSLTDSMADAFEKERSNLEQYQQAFAAQPRQVGGIFVLDGRILGAEQFDAAETYSHMLAKLVASYVVDSARNVPPQRKVPSLSEVARFLKAIQTAPASDYPALGIGRDIRLESEAVTGGALINGDRVVHLAAFSKGAFEDLQ